MPISLIYHDIVIPGGHSTSGFSGGGADSYKLTVEQFNRHLEAIERRNPRVRVCSLERLHGTKSGDGREVLLTFDDGGVGAIELTADMLESRGWKGAFFITTNCIGHHGFLSKNQIRELRRRGHVIGSHSASHPMRMAACSPEQLQLEWSSSAGSLADILGEPVTFASVPGGYYAPRIAVAADQCGIELLFTSEPTLAVNRIGSCAVLGRFSVKSGTSAREIGRLVQGSTSSLLRHKLAWTSKKLVKKVGGRAWLTIRERLLSSTIFRKSGGA